MESEIAKIEIVKMPELKLNYKDVLIKALLIGAVSIMANGLSVLFENMMARRTAKIEAAIETTKSKKK
jgi:hypothetical protein